jgi:hypothetical protein
MEKEVTPSIRAGRSSNHLGQPGRCCGVPDFRGLAPYLYTFPLAAVALSFPADPTRICLSSTMEVNYWCHTLRCSETHLRNAVLAVGLLAADVRAYLAR